MEKNVMRSMELVGRERMEVAVSIVLRDFRAVITDALNSNNSQSGVKLAMMMSRMLRISLAS